MNTDRMEGLIDSTVEDCEGDEQDGNREQGRNGADEKEEVDD